MSTVRVPGDKSIGHRALIVAALAPGPVRVANLPDAADVRSTSAALSAAGARIDWSDGTTGASVDSAAWESTGVIDCGNSGTSARLLTGLFAGLGIGATLDGDASLRRRPMDRVVYPLQAMGARIAYLEADERLPIRLAPRASGHLRVLRYRSRVASAQVKSALVLAALTAGVEFEMWEPGRSRDHTERLLAHLGVPITFEPEGEGAHLHLPAGAIAALSSTDLEIPGDPSSAAFLLAAAALAGQPLAVEDVLLNPTRTRYLEALEDFGLDVEIEHTGDRLGEPVGTVRLAARRGDLGAIELGPVGMAALIDEVPVVAMLAARASGVTRIRGAAELRFKESDRLAALATNLAALGIPVEETDDGLAIRGRPDASLSGTIATHGDHRIAMAFGALSASPNARLDIDDPACVAVSYPGYWTDLERLSGEGTS